jgi:hypothetical protein
MYTARMNLIYECMNTFTSLYAYVLHSFINSGIIYSISHLIKSKQTKHLFVIHWLD